jgi:hypothetical protein
MTDKASRTLTAGELIHQLSKVPPETPVVMSQEDEPCGDYGVRSIDLEEMQREALHAGGRYGYDTYHRSEWGTRKVWNERYDPPQTVVFLSKELPYQPVIDAELAQPELVSGVLFEGREPSE